MLHTHPFLTALFLLSGIGVHAQGQAEPRKLNDEIALDVTYFIDRFAFSDDGPYEINPYYLAYRHMFENFNLRVGIGAFHINSDEENTPNTPELQMSTVTNFDGRVGVEKVVPLARRWRFFYGIDLTYAYDHTLQGVVYQDTDYFWGSERTSNAYGVGLLAGLRFNFNDRLSLLTESRWHFAINEVEYLRTSPPLPTDNIEQVTVARGQQIDFSPPLFIMVAVAL